MPFIKGGLTKVLAWLILKVDMAKARNQEIIKLWKLGKTLEEIANDFGISKQRIHQIVFNIKNNNGNIPITIRKAVFERDGYKCRKCRDTVKSHLTLNHIVPRIIGGKNETKNLEVMCYKCNRQSFAALTRKAIKFYFAYNKANLRPEVKTNYKPFTFHGDINFKFRIPWKELCSPCKKLLEDSKKEQMTTYAKSV